MERDNLITELKEFFNIKELVDKETFDRFGERAWKFFDTDLLHSLYIIRTGINKPTTINNWSSGGSFSQRGLRTNICSIVKNKTSANKLYLSAHCLGKGVDFDVAGMEAEEVRTWIIDNKTIFPFRIRLEHKMKGKPINWVHLDTISEDINKHIHLFNV